MPTPTQPSPTVRQNLAASGAELREFVASLKGKSAAEAMGAVARSGLARGLVISLVVQAIALALLTVPYAFRGTHPQTPAAQVTPQQPSQPQAVNPATAPTATRPVETPPVNDSDKPPARPIKPATGDPDELDAADAIDRGVQD